MHLDGERDARPVGGAVSDGSAGDDVARDHHLGLVPRDGSSERVHVAREVVQQLGVREVYERNHAIEPLVLVVDEDRQQRAEVRAEDHRPSGCLPGARRRDGADPAPVVDLAPPVQEAEPIWVALLAKDQDVVAGRAHRLRHARRGHVRARAAQ